MVPHPIENVQFENKVKSAIITMEYINTTEANIKCIIIHHLGAHPLR